VNSSVDTVAVTAPDPFESIDGPAAFDEPADGAQESDGQADPEGNGQNDPEPVAPALPDRPANEPRDLSSLFSEKVDLAVPAQTVALALSLPQEVQASSFENAFEEIPFEHDSDDLLGGDALRREETAHRDLGLSVGTRDAVEHYHSDQEREQTAPGRFGLWAAVWGMFRGNGGSDSNSAKKTDETKNK